MFQIKREVNKMDGGDSIQESLTYDTGLRLCVLLTLK